MGDRPMAGLRTLTPSIKVRILVTQPGKAKAFSVFASKAFFYPSCTTFVLHFLNPIRLPSFQIVFPFHLHLWRKSTGNNSIQGNSQRNKSITLSIRCNVSQKDVRRWKAEHGQRSKNSTGGKFSISRLHNTTRNF